MQTLARKSHFAPAAALLIAIVALMLFSSATASAATPGVAKPLASAAPAASLPVTDGAPQFGSEGFQVQGIASWFLLSCNPTTPTRPAWALTSTDASVAPDTGMLPANLAFGGPQGLAYPVSLIGVGADGHTISWVSGCFADVTSNAGSTGLVDNSVADEITRDGSVSALAALPVAPVSAWEPILPGASSSTSPAQPMSVIDAPPSATSTPTPAPSHAGTHPPLRYQRSRAQPRPNTLRGTPPGWRSPVSASCSPSLGSPEPAASTPPGSTISRRSGQDSTLTPRCMGFTWPPKSPPLLAIICGLIAGGQATG